MYKIVYLKRILFQGYINLSPHLYQFYQSAFKFGSKELKASTFLLFEQERDHIERVYDWKENI